MSEPSTSTKSRQSRNFDWEIRDVYRTSKPLKSPEFAPVPGAKARWRCELLIARAPSQHRYNAVLKLVVARDGGLGGSLRVDSRVSFVNSEGRAWEPSDCCELRPLCVDIKTLPCVIATSRCAKIFPCDRESFPDGVLVVSCAFDIGESVGDARRELLGDVRSLYASGVLSDVAFDVGGQTLRAHKSVLSARSPVFRGIFERGEPDVPIPDIPVHVFNSFLGFLYSGDVADDSLDTLLGLYAAAYRFQVPSLREIVLPPLVRHMSVESVCRIYWHAHVQSDVETQRVARAYMRDHFPDVVTHQEWQRLLVSLPDFAAEIGTIFSSRQ